MNMDLLRDYDTLAKKHQLPSLTLCSLQLNSEPVTKQSDLLTVIKNFAPTQGWLSFQSQLAWFTQGQTLPDHGRILYGELSNDKNQSLHIREDGQGGWITTTYSRVEGDSHFRQNTHFISEIEALEKLNYETYWAKDEQQDKDQGMVQVAARFVGFKGTGEAQ